MLSFIFLESLIEFLEGLEREWEGCSYYKVSNVISQRLSRERDFFLFCHESDGEFRPIKVCLAQSTCQFGNFVGSCGAQGALLLCCTV